VAAVLQDRRVLGSALFTAALSHKQMALYFAPAFFAHLLGRCLQAGRGRAARQVAALGATVAFSLLLLWAPFLRSRASALQVRAGWLRARLP